MERLLRSLAAVLVVTGCAWSGPDPPRAASEPIAAALAAVPADGFTGLGRSIWIGTADLGLHDGEPLYDESADVPRPAASSIKTAYLVEFFSDRASYARRTRPGTRWTSWAIRIIPAIVHFDADTQAEIREHLETATARTVGRHMIRGTGVSNPVYNAAANLVTAFLGGPPELTDKNPGPPPGFLRHRLAPLHARRAGRHGGQHRDRRFARGRPRRRRPGRRPRDLGRGPRRDAGHPLP